MTRKDYIDELLRGLGGFDEASRRDIVLEIEDHIDELAGKHPELDEDEIVSGLEKPETLAENLCREGGVPFREDARGTGERAKDEGRGAPEPGIEDLGNLIRKALDLARLFKGAETSGNGSGEGANRTIRLRDLPVDGVKEVFCRTRASDVEIFLSNSGLSIRADGDDTPALSVTSDDGGSLSIATKPGSREPGTLRLGIPAAVDRLSVRTLSGDILVEDRLGDLALETASGDVEVRRCAGDLRVTTASGDARLSHCSGNLGVRTASGAVDARMDPECGGAELFSASGDISVRCPEGMDATIRYSTVSGDAECAGTVVGPRAVRMGEGLVPIKIRTVSGDIAVSQG